jgi:quercetin dioxygenase-like cupin family protein
MSLLKITALPYGLGTLYVYPKKGDTLEKHVHDEKSEHTIIVQRGQVKIRVWQPDGTVIETEHDADGETGFIIDTFAGYPHEIEAVTDGARTIHPPKNRS